MRSLKKIFVKGVLFLLLLFCLDRFIGSVLLKQLYNLEAGQAAQLPKALRAQADIVVLGSSRARHHYDPELIEKITGKTVFNAGVDGLYIPYIQGAADLLMSRYKPKLLVIEIDPFYFTETHFKDNLLRVEALAPYIDDSDILKEQIFDLSGFNRMVYSFHTIRFNGKPWSFLSNIIRQDCCPNGFSPIKKVMEPAEWKDKIEDKTSKYENFVLDPKAVEMLSKTIQQAKSLRVGVVLVTSPEWREQIEEVQVLLSLSSVVKTISEEEQVPYVMATLDQYPEFRDPSYYADPSHLNEQGARRFSETLGTILVHLGY
ncbi:MAG: hypothetical protein OEV87_06620 [Phycisphaerae bacterium]|nr:hypothetical protein [Phycisphaerae bacterium]